MTCGKQYPWSNCVNQKCEIDPHDKTKAICACDLVKSDRDWITYGGNSNKEACKNNYFSGAFPSVHVKIMECWNDKGI